MPHTPAVTCPSEVTGWRERLTHALVTVTLSCNSSVHSESAHSDFDLPCWGDVLFTRLLESSRVQCHVRSHR